MRKEILSYYPILVLWGLALMLPIISAPSVAESSGPVNGMAMHGEPKYEAEFTHFDYASENAEKGGSVKLAAISSGGFDSLNPYILKGIAANGISTYFYETLTANSDDEAFSQYAWVAEKMDIADDRSWVIFEVNRAARFHDGHPITAEDVKFSFELLIAEGNPFYAAYYYDVSKVEILGTHKIKFTSGNPDNRELPLILGQIPIFPAHYWENHNFNETSLNPPVGSGPYRIKSVDPSRRIVYERVKDYWAKDIPVNKGRFNFDEISIDYYRDATVAIEALKSAEYDFRAENSAKAWATQYVGPKFDSGEIVREQVPHEIQTGMQAFVFNTRLDKFSDARVRRALGYMFDFEWTNKNIFYSQYARTLSYFSNSELASTALPGPEELKILELYRDQLPRELFTEPYTLPTTKGDGNIRGLVRESLRLLKAAGWEVKNKQLTQLSSGEVMAITFLIYDQSSQRMILPLTKNLERLGVNSEVQMVDTQQYVNRISQFEFEVFTNVFAQSNSPGNEQRDFWHSEEVNNPGSRNVIGVSNPVVDALITKVIDARDRDDLIFSTRALDRVLLWQHYVIPQFHSRNHRLVYWDKFEKPTISPKYAVGLENWWAKKP